MLNSLKPFGFRSGEGYPLDFVPVQKQVNDDIYEMISLETFGIKGFVVQRKGDLFENGKKKEI